MSVLIIAMASYLLGFRAGKGDPDLRGTFLSERSRRMLVVNCIEFVVAWACVLFFPLVGIKWDKGDVGVVHFLLLGVLPGSLAVAMFAVMLQCHDPSKARSPKAVKMGKESKRAATKAEKFHDSPTST